MNNTRFAVMLGLLALIVFATMLIIRSYNPSKEFQLAEQQELTEIAKIKSLLGEAYELIQINQLNAAEKKLHLLLRHAPNNFIALQMLGNVYFAQKKYDEAVLEAEKALLRYPNDFKIVYRSGELYTVDGVKNAILDYMKGGNK